MHSTNLLDKVFEVLHDDKEWQSRIGKSRNLINAFALVYDKHLFENAKYSTLREEAPKANFVIDEISIITTEFFNCMKFNFSTGSGIVGNHYLNLKRGKKANPILGQILLGDILACSSCFPGGFEPLMFPVDLVHHELSKEQLIGIVSQKELYTSRKNINDDIAFGIMDGGIDDNQGIHSFLDADDRRKGEEKFDLYFSCDVSSNFIKNPFEYPVPLTSYSWLQWTCTDLLKKLNTFGMSYLIIAFVLLDIGIFLNVFYHLSYWGMFIMGAILSAIAIPLIALWFITSRLVPAVAKRFCFDSNDSWKSTFDRYKNKLLNLTLDQAIIMLRARLRTVRLMSDSAYLKKIRRISYEHLFTKKTLRNDSKPWNDHIGMAALHVLSTKNNRMLQPLIKELAEEMNKGQAFNSALLQPSINLRAVIDKAVSMDTTLWFTKEDIAANMQENITAAGQATMCFQMMVNVWKLSDNRPEWDVLKNQLYKDWLKFQETPLWLYTELLKDSH